MVNRLSTEKRALALHALVEGMSMRATSRLARISLNTVYKLHADAGDTALAYHKKVAKDLDVSLVQCDEIWAFCYAKEGNVPDAENAPPEAGDVWTWTALDVVSKFMLAWETGDRKEKSARKIMNNLKKRLGGRRIQLTTDGHRPYLKAVPDTFGDDIDFATLVKSFRLNCDPLLDSRVVIGEPDPLFINTSYVERANLSMRMGMRRFTRKTNGFSKSVENHRHSVALHFLYHNFCWEHGSLGKGVTPAMALGLADEPYTTEWISDLIDERTPPPNRPKTYKKSRTMARKQRVRRMKANRERVRKSMARKSSSV